jgi:F0F1-type ATP synthase membrane subunit b/b'
VQKKHGEAESHVSRIIYMLAISLIVSLFSVSTTLGLLFLYFRLQRKYVTLVKHEERLSRSKRVARKTRVKAHKILDEARDNAQRVLQESNIKAQQVVNEAQVFSDDQKKYLLDSIKKYSDQEAINYQNLLENIKKDSMNMLGGISNTINEAALQEIELFRGNIQTQVQSADKSMKTVITTAVNQTRTIIDQYQKQSMNLLNEQKQKVDSEISAYKNQKMKQVNEKIFEIIREVTKDYFGKSLNPKEHEDVVYKSLEKAKKDNLF